MDLLLLLSGPVAVGKSAVANELARASDFRGIKSGKYLADLARHRGKGTDRTSLQCLGDQLDQDTDYLWLVDDVATAAINAEPTVHKWLLDSVRKKRQVEQFRMRFSASVFHAHLTAPEIVLKQRYDSRLSAGGEYLGNVPYEIAVNHPNEVSARDLNCMADCVIDVASVRPEEAARVILDLANQRKPQCDKSC